MSEIQNVGRGCAGCVLVRNIAVIIYIRVLLSYSAGRIASNHGSLFDATLLFGPSVYFIPAEQSPCDWTYQREVVEEHRLPLEAVHLDAHNAEPVGGRLARLEKLHEYVLHRVTPAVKVTIVRRTYTNRYLEHGSCKLHTVMLYKTWNTKNKIIYKNTN